MSAVNLLSALQEKSSDDSFKEGSNHKGHDESGADAGRRMDPAVLAVGPARPPLQYSMETLYRLKDSPLSKRGLDMSLMNRDALALILKKPSDAPNEDDKGAKGDAPNENHKGGGYGRSNRAADPRERVRKESETTSGGIVLSPQRRSFTSGCAAPTPTAPHPPAAGAPAAGAQQPNVQNKQEQGRRIGSGRIMVRDVPNSGWEETEYRNSEPYRPPQRDRDRDRNDNRFERRSFTRDSYSSEMKRERDDRFNEKNRDREDNRRSGGRYSQRRYEKEDEPEWFSAGPTSQLETIELRGFDDPISDSSQTTDNKESEDRDSNAAPAENNSSGQGWRDSPTPPAVKEETHATNKEQQEPTAEPRSNEQMLIREQQDFNLDYFLKIDKIPDVLTNGSGETEGSSLFSRWFRKESPTNSDSKHYERLMHNMVDDLDSSTQMEPPSATTQPVISDSSMFAPIAPATSAAPRTAPPSLLAMLRRANTAERQTEMNSMGGQVHSLEELEARLRPQHSAPAQHVDHDLTAFKRLLAQVSGGHAVPAANEVHPRSHQPQQQPQTQQPQHLSLLQMLHKSMEQQQQQQQKPPPPPPPPQSQHQQPYIPPELLYKLLQVQQQQHANDMNTNIGGGMSSSMGSAGAAGIGPSHADRELLQRPEAQAIIHGLKAGEITVQHLFQQLNNPGLQSRHREVLITILRIHQQQRQLNGSPSPGNVGGMGGAGGSHLLVPPHHQPLRISPLPHPAFCVSPIMATSPNTLSVHHSGVPARIPSPRELAAHTQSIMQSALIKKKLEEQRENFRRRQEQHKQPTTISFTPTSVLRKMTAEKESEAPSTKHPQWAQPMKMPQGRPIVKGNQSGAVPSMSYAPAQNDYQQQHYLNQQQMSNLRSFQHGPQQRQQAPNSLNNMSNYMSRGAAGGGATLHQLLMQSHQNSINEMSGLGAASGGGDNQLARWFSPELLARASAGKLPSVHVPNALSLEELERHHHSPASAVRN